MLGLLCAWKIFIPIINSVNGFQVIISEETVFPLLDSTSRHKVSQLHYLLFLYFSCYALRNLKTVLIFPKTK